MHFEEPAHIYSHLISFCFGITLISILLFGNILITIWLGNIQVCGWIPEELIEVIRLGWIEILPVWTEIFQEWQMELLHSHYHHLGHLIGSVWIEVGIIL